MRRLFLTVLVCAFFLLSVSAVFAENTPSFTLPASIQVIGDDAFEGTLFHQEKEEAETPDDFLDLILAQQNGEKISAAGTLYFPAGLLVIEEESFAGTHVLKIVLPEKLESVGSRAFAGIEELEAVYIPDSVRLIADDAFDGAKKLRVYGSEGGYAEEWAVRNGFDFVQLFMPLPLGFQLKHLSFLLWLSAAAIVLLKVAKDTGRKTNEGKTMRPQERAELNDIHLCFP